MKRFVYALAAFCAVSCTNAQKADDNQVDSQYRNAVIEAIMERRSVRQYTDEPVAREDLQLIAECGVNAPNAMNAQQWEVRIVDRKDWIDGMTDLYLTSIDPQDAAAIKSDSTYRNMFRNGTALIVVAVKPGGMTAIDAGLMGENMMLAAHSLGYGTCCLGSPARFLKSVEAEGYLKALKFSDGYEVQYILAVGHPAESPAAKPRNLDVIKFL